MLFRSPTTGTSITKILPRISPFTPDGKRLEKKKMVIERLMKFFERFFDISNKDFDK